MGDEGDKGGAIKAIFPKTWAHMPSWLKKPFAVAFMTAILGVLIVGGIVVPLAMVRACTGTRIESSPAAQPTGHPTPPGPTPTPTPTDPPVQPTSSFHASPSPYPQSAPSLRPPTASPGNGPKPAPPGRSAEAAPPRPPVSIGTVNGPVQNGDHDFQFNG